jgi:enoyl-CoA hydratase/carnithine racemase
MAQALIAIRELRRMMDETRRSMDESPILVEQRDGYRVLTLNRPQRLNAFTEPMHVALREALAAVEADAGCRALLLTGAGRGFCAGQDLNDRLSQGGDTAVLGGTLEAYYNPLVRKLRALPFPIVAAVNGVAAGAGLVFSLASDIRLAAPEARFNMANVRIGFSGCDLGSSYWLPRTVGLGVASELLMTGRFMGAEEAERRAVINRIVPAGELLDSAIATAAEIARNSPFAVRMTKQVLASNVDAPSLRAAVELENRTQILCTRTDDFVEALAAFQEKRDPQFTGS